MGLRGPQNIGLGVHLGLDAIAQMRLGTISTVAGESVTIQHGQFTNVSLLIWEISPALHTASTV